MVSTSSLQHIRVFYAAYFAAMGLILPFFPVYLTSLGYDIAKVGVMTGLLAAAKVIAPPCSGYWLDKKQMPEGRFIVLASCSAAICVGLFNVSSESTFVFSCVVLFFGMLWAAVLPLTDGLSIHVSEIALADYGRLRVWGSIGFVLTSLLGGMLFDVLEIAWFPWLLVFLMLIMALAGVGFPTLLHDSDKIKPTVTNQFTASLLLLFAISFLVQCSHGAYYGFFSLYLLDIGYQGWQVGLFWVLGTFAEIILLWFWAKPIQAMSFRRVVQVCLLLSIIRWFGTGFSHIWWWMLLLQLLHAATFAAFHVIAVAWVKRLSPNQSQAVAQGWYASTGYGLGSTVGIIGCGMIVQWYGFSMAFYACAVIALGAMLLAWKLPK